MTKNKKSGEITDDRSGRWCEICNQEHGLLYNCANYSPEIREEIESHHGNWKTQLNDPEFCKQHPAHVIAIQRIFAGLPAISQEEEIQ